MTRNTRRRLATAVLAPSAALAAWEVTQVAGVDLVLSRGGGGGSVGALDVVVAALVAALAGWWVARLVERRAREPRRIWMLIATTALAVSIVGPSRLADGTSAAALIGLHVVTAVVVITGLAGTLPCRARGVRAPHRATSPS